jgi:hypothetical protein
VIMLAGNKLTKPRYLSFAEAEIHAAILAI